MMMNFCNSDSNNNNKDNISSDEDDELLLGDDEEDEPAVDSKAAVLEVTPPASPDSEDGAEEEENNNKDLVDDDDDDNVSQNIWTSLSPNPQYHCTNGRQQAHHYSYNNSQLYRKPPRSDVFHDHLTITTAASSSCNQSTTGYSPASFNYYPTTNTNDNSHFSAANVVATGEWAESAAAAVAAANAAHSATSSTPASHASSTTTPTNNNHNNNHNGKPMVLPSPLQNLVDEENDDLWRPISDGSSDEEDSHQLAEEVEPTAVDSGDDDEEEYSTSDEFKRYSYTSSPTASLESVHYPSMYHDQQHYIAARTSGGLTGGCCFELHQQLKTSLPTFATMILSKLPWLISLWFLGHQFQVKELAAAALATSVWNLTGYSLVVGLSSALSALSGQARAELKQQYLQQEQYYSSSKLLLLQQQQGSVSVSAGEETPLINRYNNGRKTKRMNGRSPSPATRYMSVGATAAIMVVENEPQVVTFDEQTASTATEQPESNTPILPLVYLYQSIVIQLLVVIPIGLWWMSPASSSNGNSFETMLVQQLGQDPHLSKMTLDYLRILTPGLWTYSINWTFTAWLQTIEMPDVTAWSSFISLVCHIPLNLFYIQYMEYGYLGCAAATLTFQCLQPFLTLVYLFVLPCGRRRTLRNLYVSVIQRRSLSFWLEFRHALSCRSICVYLSLAVPGVIAVSEWWASEVAILLGGRMHPSPQIGLGAMTLYQAILTLCFMFPVASSVAGATRVSHLLGAGDAYGARYSAYNNVLCGLLVSGALSSVLYFTPHDIFPSLFVTTSGSDEGSHSALIHEASRTIPILALYVLGDGLQCAFTGIARGCGRQLVTMPVVVFAYWAVGLPLAYYIAFVRNGGSSTECHNSYYDYDMDATTTTSGAAVGLADDDIHRQLLDVASVGGNITETLTNITGTLTQVGENITDTLTEAFESNVHDWCGAVGLVVGMTAGTWVHMVLLGFIILCSTNWRKEAKRATGQRMDSPPNPADRLDLHLPVDSSTIDNSVVESQT